MPRERSCRGGAWKIARLTSRRQKLYKTMFKKWGWQKNLSTDTALKMMERSKRRKREEGKDTVFVFGGRVWDSHRVESTLVRTKKPRVTIDLTSKFSHQWHSSLSASIIEFEIDWPDRRSDARGRELQDPQGACRVPSPASDRAFRYGRP